MGVHMRGIGIAAVVLAVTAVLVPIVGPCLTVPSAVLAAMAGRSGRTLGIVALLINTVNLYGLSPSLWFAMDQLALAGDDGATLLTIMTLTFGLQAAAAGLLLLAGVMNHNETATPVA